MPVCDSLPQPGVEQGDSNGILIEGNASTVIESLSSFRVGRDWKVVKVSLSNL